MTTKSGSQDKRWVAPQLVRMGTIAQIAATQSTFIQTGNSKS